MGGMVWSARELWYGLVSLIEVRKAPPAGLCSGRLAWIAMVVVEIEGEWSSHTVICVIFDVWVTG